MNRRRFLQASAAVVLTKGLLMPVRRVWTPREPRIYIGHDFGHPTDWSSIVACIHHPNGDIEFLSWREFYPMPIHSSQARSIVT